MTRPRFRRSLPERAEEWLCGHPWIQTALTIALIGVLFALAMTLLLPWEPKP